MKAYVTDLQVGYYGPAARLGAFFEGADPHEVDEKLLEKLGQPGPQTPKPAPGSEAPVLSTP